MQVTTTDFKLNLDKYLKLVQTEDILITKNGKPVAKLINPNISSVDSKRTIKIKNRRMARTYKRIR